MKYDAQKHKFAVIQSGCGVFGVGETAEQAKQDAVEWMDDCSSAQDVQDVIDSGRGFVGDFKLSDDAEKIREYVEAN